PPPETVHAYSINGNANSSKGWRVSADAPHFPTQPQPCKGFDASFAYRKMDRRLSPPRGHLLCSANSITDLQREENEMKPEPSDPVERADERRQSIRDHDVDIDPDGTVHQRE